MAVELKKFTHISFSSFKYKNRKNKTKLEYQGASIFLDLDPADGFWELRHRQIGAPPNPNFSTLGFDVVLQAFFRLCNLNYNSRSL